MRGLFSRVRISESLPHHLARISESGYTNVRFRDSEIPLQCSGGDSEITTQKAIVLYGLDCKSARTENECPTCWA